MLNTHFLHGNRINLLFGLPIVDVVVVVVVIVVPKGGPLEWPQHWTAMLAMDRITWAELPLAFSHR